jgi:hypothetical protein
VDGILLHKAMEAGEGTIKRCKCTNQKSTNLNFCSTRLYSAVKHVGAFC